MMAEDWLGGLQSPTLCGKRPRSPVEKLANLAGAGDDEQDWRSSKRYLTEVISNGFSKLSFKLGLQQQQAQQQQQLIPQEQHQQQLDSPGSLAGQLSSATNAATNGAPQQPTVQLPDTDCAMDMQESPPTWPPQQQQQHCLPPPPLSTSAFSSAHHEQHLHPAVQSLNGGASRPHSTSTAKQQAAHEGMQQPFGSIPACLSPNARAAQAAAASGSGGGGLAGPAGATGLTPGPPSNKALQGSDKPPASPSDLPAASLRKVALLRSLLARAEQQLHQHHGPDPTAHSAAQHLQQPQPQQHQQHHLQQQQQGWHPFAGSTADQQVLPPDAACAAGYAAPFAQCSTSLGAAEQQQQPPRPFTPLGVCQDDMECSSSSMGDADTGSGQQATSHTAAYAADAAADPTANSLLCSEVLLPVNDDDGYAVQQQQQQHVLHEEQQQQRAHGVSLQPHLQLPFVEHPAAPQLPVGPGHMPGSANYLQEQQQCQWVHQQAAAALHSQHSIIYQQPHHQQQQQYHYHHQQHHQQQQQENVQLPSTMMSPELSRARLEELRAKALASTSQLACLEDDGLHGLQLSQQTRRGSTDSHSRSMLQGVVASALQPAVRRNSSHI